MNMDGSWMVRCQAGALHEASQTEGAFSYRKLVLLQFPSQTVALAVSENCIKKLHNIEAPFQ